MLELGRCSIVGPKLNKLWCLSDGVKGFYGSGEVVPKKGSRRCEQEINCHGPATLRIAHCDKEVMLALIAAHGYFW
jgi:hypothetical protein